MRLPQDSTFRIAKGLKYSLVAEKIKLGSRYSLCCSLEGCQSVYFSHPLSMGYMYSLRGSSYGRLIVVLFSLCMGEKWPCSPWRAFEVISPSRRVRNLPCFTWTWWICILCIYHIPNILISSSLQMLVSLTLGCIDFDSLRQLRSVISKPLQVHCIPQAPKHFPGEIQAYIILRKSFSEFQFLFGFLTKTIFPIIHSGFS